MVLIVEVGVGRVGIVDEVQGVFCVAHGSHLVPRSDARSL